MEAPTANTTPNTHQHLRWMLHDSPDPVPQSTIVQTLRQGGHLMAVSDGSFHPTLHLGTSAWMIKPVGHQEILQGHNIVPGPSSSQCSTAVNCAV